MFIYINASCVSSWTGHTCVIVFEYCMKPSAGQGRNCNKSFLASARPDYTQNSTLQCIPLSYVIKSPLPLLESRENGCVCSLWALACPPWASVQGNKTQGLSLSCKICDIFSKINYRKIQKNAMHGTKEHINRRNVKQKKYQEKDLEWVITSINTLDGS